MAQVFKVGSRGSIAQESRKWMFPKNKWGPVYLGVYLGSSWLGGVTSVRLSFLLCEMEIMTIPTSWNCENSVQKCLESSASGPRNSAIHCLAAASATVTREAAEWKGTYAILPLSPTCLSGLFHLLMFRTVITITPSITSDSECRWREHGLLNGDRRAWELWTVSLY